MAFSTCNITASNAIAEQTPRIELSIAKDHLVASPYANLLPTATVESNIGENIITVTPTRTVTGQSLVKPVFGDLSAACGTTGNTARWGQESYTTKLEMLRGESQPICVNQNRFTVKNSLSAAVSNLKEAIMDIYNSDTRAEIVTKSGTKATLLTTDGTVPQTLTGGEYQVNAPWRGVLPTQTITFAYLKSLSDYARYNYYPEQYGMGADSHAIFVGSSEAVDSLRNEADVNNVLSVTTQGSFKEGKDSLWKYSWIDVNFRGIKMAIDPKPLRFNQLNVSGAPIFLEPYQEVAMDYGTANLSNPLWQSAAFEVGILHYKNSFKRLVPEKYTGEGEAKFAMQAFGGELQWNYTRDNSCNQWGDFGFFQYQIARAFQPIKPWVTIPIAYKRCAGSLGFGGTCAVIPQIS